MAQQLRDAVTVRNLLLQASLDPARWLDALGALATATGSLRGQLVGIGARGDLAFGFVTRSDDSFDEFLRQPGIYDPETNYRVAAAAAPGEIGFEEHYREIRARQGPTAYEEACEQQRIPFGCQTVLSNEGGALIGLALLRTRRDGPTTPEQRALFAALAPHVRSAIHCQLATESRGIALVQGALDAVNAPALLVDGFGRVMAMTPAAESVLALTTRLDVRERALIASMPGQTRRIQALLGGVLRGDRPEATMMLRGGGEPPLALAMHALPDTDWELGFRPHAVIMLRGGAASPGELRDTLLIEFGLTCSEADIALQLAACTPRAQIAEARGTSLGTVRQQIKAVFAKLEVRRESEFMALLASLDRR